MKVLFVSHSSELYGSERSLLTLVQGLKKRRKIEPSVLMPCDGPLRDALEKLGIEVHIIPFTRWIHRGNIFAPAYHAARNYISLRRSGNHLRDLSAELIYSNSLTNPFGALLADKWKLPHIWHVREFVHEDLGSRFDWGNRKSADFIRKTSKKVICNSKAVLDKWKRYIPENKLDCIYNGFDFDSFPYKESNGTHEPLRLILTGSIQSGKGQLDAIRAVSDLAKRHVNCKLSLVGSNEDAAYFESLKKAADSGGVGGRIQWKGFCADYMSEFMQADIALSCSKQEAFGRTQVEAMAMGVPVIAADSGASREIITHQKTGLLYTAGNHEQLADAIRALQQDSQLRLSLAKEAREEVLSRFASEIYVAKIENTIDGVLKNS